MASEVEICNRALQKLGAKRIVSLDDNSVNARACNVAYSLVRDRVLRSHPWNCAISRAELAADAEPPEWGRANAFQLPSDFLRLLPPYPEMNINDLDWQIEGRKILTDDSGPIYLRYIYQVTDPNEMDPLLRELISTELALELCEEITQSNTKKDALKDDVKAIVKDARRVNAFECVAQEPPEDTWITVRD
jgi:hypothetical protein